MTNLPPGDRGGASKTDAEWLDEVADMAEAFVGNTIETIGSIELLLPEQAQSEAHKKRLAEVKQRIEMLETLLIECRELSASIARTKE